MPTLHDNQVPSIDEVISDLFDAGKTYGEDLSYAKQGALYEIRDSAITSARTTLTQRDEAIRQEERARACEIVEEMDMSCECGGYDDKPAVEAIAKIKLIQ